MKDLRLFSCRACDHSLRFGSTRCGDCYAPTPFYNHAWLHYSLVAVGLLLLGLTAIGFALQMLEAPEVLDVTEN